jgi:hypothetical protein
MVRAGRPNVTIKMLKSCDASLRAKALDNLDRWSARRSCSAPYHDKWLLLLLGNIGDWLAMRRLLIYQISMNLRFMTLMMVVYVWASVYLSAEGQEPPHEYVDSNIHIVLPVHLAKSKDGYFPESNFNDGGTRMISIIDASGKKFDVYIDHRLEKKKQWGTVYLFAYPETPNSIRLTKQKAFKSQILDPLGVN